MTPEEKLNELGFEVPSAPEPVAEYIPVRKAGGLIFCSGQGPVVDDEFVYTGRIGKELGIEEGFECAQICALNCLAAINSISPLHKIEKIVKVRGFVNSADDFTDQPQVINGASELLINVFEDRGKHARSALGTSVLPDNIPVELEMIVKTF